VILFYQWNWWTDKRV